MSVGNSSSTTRRSSKNPDSSKLSSVAYSRSSKSTLTSEVSLGNISSPSRTKRSKDASSVLANPLLDTDKDVGRLVCKPPSKYDRYVLENSIAPYCKRIPKRGQTDLSKVRDMRVQLDERGEAEFG